jgi:hypothetical protein
MDKNIVQMSRFTV